MADPWMVVGDFNIILEASERVRGARPRLRDMEDTWMNRRLWQRPDSAFINSWWSERFLVTHVSHL